MADPQALAQLAAVVAELDRRRRRERFLAGGALSPWQAKAWADESRDQVWICGRRAGKTDLAMKLLAKTALGEERVQSVYVNTTIKRALATVWDELLEVNAEFELGGVPNVVKSSITFPNRSRLVVTGCENKKMANDIRGRRRVKRYHIDEGQDWDPDLLRYFIEQVVHWSKADVRGECGLSGTGGAPQGYWAWLCSPESGFSVHTATAFDNPFLAPGEAQALIAKACKERGVDESDPGIQREFYARFVADLNRQIFPYDPAKNGYTPEQLPRGQWFHVVSGDVGTVDATDVGKLGWCDTDPRLWLLRHSEVKGIGATKQLELYRTYLTDCGDTLAGAVLDPGGGGAALIADLGAGPNGIQVEAAEKQGKVAACLLMRDALRTGMLMLPAGDERLIRQLTSVEWDPQAIGSVIRGHMPDPVDMLLYGFRKARALNWYHPPEPEKPPPTDAELMEERWNDFDHRAAREDDWLDGS